jgi:hypothetical protein
MDKLYATGSDHGSLVDAQLLLNMQSSGTAA